LAERVDALHERVCEEDDADSGVHVVLQMNTRDGVLHCYLDWRKDVKQLLSNFDEEDYEERMEWRTQLEDISLEK